MSGLAYAIGALAGMAASAARDRLMTRPQDRRDFGRVVDCTMAIVLCGRDDADFVSRTVDDATGKGGWSHAYFDPCRANDDGDRVVIDYTVARGVHWAPADTYAHRRLARIELDDLAGLELWGCVRSRIGNPLRVEAIALRMQSAANCVGLIVSCLPWHMQDDLQQMREGPCISANTLARYFGVNT